MTFVFGGVFSKGRKPLLPSTKQIGGRVLESASGPGSRCRNMGRNLRIFGTDISEAMLQRAKKRRMPRASVEEYREPRGDGRREARIPRQFVRRS